jgi:hypothetical protein
LYDIFLCSLNIAFITHHTLSPHGSSVLTQHMVILSKEAYLFVVNCTLIWDKGIVLLCIVYWHLFAYCFFLLNIYLGACSWYCSWICACYMREVRNLPCCWEFANKHLAICFLPLTGFTKDWIVTNTHSFADGYISEDPENQIVYLNYFLKTSYDLIHRGLFQNLSTRI